MNTPHTQFEITSLSTKPNILKYVFILMVKKQQKHFTGMLNIRNCNSNKQQEKRKTF